MVNVEDGNSLYDIENKVLYQMELARKKMEDDNSKEDVNRQ